MPVVEFALVRDYRGELIAVHFARKDVLLPASGRDTSAMASNRMSQRDLLVERVVHVRPHI
jgi:hypothetical protein